MEYNLIDLYPLDNDQQDKLYNLVDLYFLDTDQQHKVNMN
tara:strand:- start:26 stop:145 length:120 start_codon:yes stop_codon:yes gene_type:complete